MGLRPLEIFQFFQRGDRLYTSGEILTYKDGLRAERVNGFIYRDFKKLNGSQICDNHIHFDLANSNNF